MEFADESLANEVTGGALYGVGRAVHVDDLFARGRLRSARVHSSGPQWGKMDALFRLHCKFTSFPLWARLDLDEVSDRLALRAGSLNQG